jgi:hypothetical protein
MHSNLSRSSSTHFLCFVGVTIHSSSNLEDKCAADVEVLFGFVDIALVHLSNPLQVLESDSVVTHESLMLLEQHLELFPWKHREIGWQMRVLAAGGRVENMVLDHGSVFAGSRHPV